jgi:hypothetical protein
LDRDRLTRMSDLELRQIIENAIKRDRIDVAVICEEILDERHPPKNSSGKTITEFHFICRKGTNLSPFEGGFFKSGQWVVAEEHCERAKKYGSIVALHVDKRQSSYFQGSIVDYWRVFNERTQRWRVEFILQPTEQSLPWYGDGSGERGYRYED